MSRPFIDKNSKIKDRIFHCIYFQREEKGIMKKTEMMKKNYEFRNVLTKGAYYSGKYIEAFIKKNKQDYVNFLGIAISVKVAKAVKRNHIKRLLRENYQEQEKSIKKGYSIVFLWKKKADIREAKYQNIQRDMQKIFNKAKLIEESYEKNIDMAN